MTIPISDDSERATCPACKTAAPVVIVKKNHHYHACPKCDCVFTPKLVSEIIVTENNGHSGRHDQNQDATRLKRLVDKLGRAPGLVIDFGCGQGETTRFLQAHGVNTIGIDQNTPVQLKDLADASVDGIMMVEVIEHLFDPRTIFQEFNRILKTGGVVYMESSFADKKNLAEWDNLDPAIGHCTLHTLKSMFMLASENGFMATWLNANVCCFSKLVSVQTSPQPAMPEAPVAAVEIIGEGLANPLVSLVISAYNSEKYMRACLTNLTRQTIFDQCEIIIVDSGSPTNERAIVLEFQEKFSNIRYVRTAREKVAEAWNRGLALARAPYFASLSADDTIRDDGLAVMAAALERHQDCGLVYGDVGWTSQPNDTFPCANLLRTVKYPDYTPLETMYYCLTGCVQFFRTSALRQVGGFDPALFCAADYEVILKMVTARMNVVHVPEVLTLFYQNTGGISQSTNRSAEEHALLTNRYRANLDITEIFEVEPNRPTSVADAFAMLGISATKIKVPWEDQTFEHADFAFGCFHAALKLDPENLAAGTHLIALSAKLNRLAQHEAELVARWPKMREWIANFKLGEGTYSPVVKHTRLGPVYRPTEFSDRPTAEQLAREPKVLQPWITRIDGRHVYLSEDFFPRPAGLRYTSEELQNAGKKLVELMMALPPFYAHLGGAGDALLLLASFYDAKPNSVVFSHPNGVPAAKAFFDAFPGLQKIYFLPQHSEPYFHISLRYLVCTLRNCLGAGTTPKDDYIVEWKAGLDLEKKYRIKKAPRWAAAFRKNTDSRQIAVAPKGSLSGMVGSKRNIIAPEIWPQVIAHIQSRGFEPVILGMPAEAKEYPALPGCVDARKETFTGQMQRIGQCAGLVGADSWAKSFSALAEIPTLVFEPLKSADLITWKDASDWIFIEPWPAIKMLRSLDQFRAEFDARIAKIPGSATQKKSAPVIAWQGSFLDYGSLSHINRELTHRLASTLNPICVGSNVLPAKVAADPVMQRCAKKISATPPARATVTVRHQWPPNWSRPASGALVVIQPWEFGSLPLAWVEAAKNVDEFWVPSPIVRSMYLDSGIAPEKVRVVPNGVDTKKFCPGVRPLKLATRKKFKFLFVGGTIHRKGPDVLLDAFLNAFTANDDVCLVIKDFGGDSFYQGQTAAELIRSIQKNPHAPEIMHLTNDLSQEQMPALYAACDCLVHPYRGEGFGMPVLEAMACGLPVIVTGGGATESFVAAAAGWKIPGRFLRLNGRVGDIPLVKSGWLIEPSKSHLAALLKNAASHPEECRKRGAAGREIAEKSYDWNDIAAMVQHRLREMAESVPQAESGHVELPALPNPSAPAQVQPPITSAKAIILPAVAQIGQLGEARELLATKNFQAAWSAVLSALAQRPFHPEAFLLLAEISLAAGAGDVAKICAQRARDLAPGWNAPKQFLSKPLNAKAKPEWLVLPNQSGNKLSVCLIAKNEEKFLAQCLQSVCGLAAQIVVLDTGSTDRTIEIAREYGAEVHSLAWADDFSAARNAALAHATGDWILMLDADEELPTEQHPKLLADLKNSGVIALRLPLVNRGQEDEGRSFVPRLFRNLPGVFFHGRIHEQVFASLLPAAKKWGLRTALGTAEILHHGYTQEMVRDRNKVERNLKLLRTAVAENPEDANLVMNFGMELVRSGDLPGGIEKYRAAFALMSAQPASDIVPELREALLTQFVCQLYKVSGHEEVLRVLASPLAKNGGLTASLHLSFGLSQFELKNYSAAADQMRHVLAKRNQTALTPINLEIHSAAPLHCLALCHARLGDAAGAEKYFSEAVAMPSRANEARVDFAKFLVEQQRPTEALQTLHAAITADAQCLPAWRLGGEIALSRAEFLEFAADWTGEAFRILPANPVIAAQRAEALMLNGDAVGAAEIWENIWRSEPDARPLAAMILCETIGAKTAHSPNNSEDERATSLAFIAWYQRLIAVRAAAVTARVNERLEKLSRALPSAAQMLQAALAEAATPARV